MSKWHGGKGSKRRPEKEGVYQDQWEKIFGKPEPKIKEHKKTPKHGVTQVHKDKTKLQNETDYEMKRSLLGLKINIVKLKNN